jgi:acetoin utilization deacetylase AcuC-like enzyme
LITHDAEYFARLKEQRLSEREQRHIGFPQSPQLTQRELIITQGTIDCCNYAMRDGVALNVAGGTHHAFRDRGEGFCLLNDFAVAANYLLHKGDVKKIVIIDLDVHQGNGTASLFANEPRVFTFSMHGAHNYPFHKEQSDLDIPLPDGIRDEAYLRLLTVNLEQILHSHQPDFAFYLSGVDILETDKFGKLKITTEGCKQRDEIVFTMLKERNIPCVVSMGGGYSPDVRHIVDAHCNTYRAARLIF